MNRNWLAVLSLAMLSLLPESAAAQTYCASYDDGTRQCDFPTLQACQESITGVGGDCEPGQQSELPPNLLQRLRQRRQQEAPSAQPGATWMPPPPN